MTRTLIALLALAALCGAACAQDNALTPDEQAAGWKLLFDGTTFDGWNLSGHEAGWAIADGAVQSVAGQDGYYLATTERYGNFVLSLDFNCTPGANSGVFFRWDKFEDPVQTGLEAQILDSFGAQPSVHQCAALYEFEPPIVNTSKAPGEWQHMDIAAIDNIIVITQNGVPVTLVDTNQWTTAHQNPDGTGNKFDTALKDWARSGLIGLQHHGAEVHFKNIKILPLD